MAAYNGAKYIESQISSILPQLDTCDELVIINDASQDDTVKVIKTVNDPRIKLIHNDANLGIIKTFEKALINASGDLIFLSDQDDIWLPKKVLAVKQILEEKPEVTLVLSDAYIIDTEDKITADSYFKVRGKFISGTIPNIIKNKYLGCTMAFRKKMLDYCLPFPKDIPMHDMWIGIINDIYGKIFYIEEPLMQYRLHGHNASRGPVKYAGIQQILKWRYALVKNLIKQILNNSVYK